MLSHLLTWLDASDARHWAAAWGIFGVTTGLAAASWLFPRPRAWWRHPAAFAALLLLTIFAFRWPVVFYNTQLADPDESQLIAGALTLRHDPLFWRSVDGTTHGPLAELPLLAPLLAGRALDFTGARIVSVFLAWVTVVAAWLVFRRLFDDGVARMLTLPLLAVHAFTHNWYFAQYSSEHAPAALLAVGCALLLTAWDPAGDRPRPRQLFFAGLALGLVSFAKLQSAPIATWSVIAGIVLIFASPNLAGPARRRAVGGFVGGALAGPAAVLVTVALAGAWLDFWQSYVVNNLSYAGARWFTWRETPAKLFELGQIAEGFNPFFLWLAAFGAGGLLLWPRFEPWHRRCTLFAGGLLLAAVYAVMAPGRMFMHYVQLIMFPAALFGGIVAGAAERAMNRDRTPAPLSLSPGHVAILLFLGCGLVPQIVWRAGQSYPHMNQFTATRGALIQSPAAREILRHATPGERLAIWGWMPTFWVETGLLQGTRDGNCYRQIEPSPDRDFYRARFLADLQRNQPRVFADAVGGDNQMYQDRAAQAHDTFSALRDYIATNYRLVGDVAGTRIYVRSDRQ